MQFSQNAGYDKLRNSLLVSEIESDCGNRVLIFENKKSSPTLSLQNLAASVVETVICHQNSRLNGVYSSVKGRVC